VEEGGRVETLPARLVVGAEGHSSVVRSSSHFTVLRDPEDPMIAGVLLDHVPSPENTLEVIYHFAIGQVVIVVPQGRGRARVYVCYHDNPQPRFQGNADLSGFAERCMHTGANASNFKDSRQIGPLATFSCAQT
jgi:2-polyprenyl-6-methoxyphenol hydroxylase-like FAD-dependent oxidoreductase